MKNKGMLIFSAVIIAMFCALTLCFTLAFHETFYWLPGMPYFWAGTLIVLALSLAVKSFRGSCSSFILCMIVLFLNSINLEQPCVFQGIIAFLAMICFMFRRKKSLALMSGVFWLVSVAGFCVMYFAPGTSVRMGRMDSAEVSAIIKIFNGLKVAFSLGILNTFQFLAKPVIYAVIFFLPAIARKIPPADEKISCGLKAWHIVATMFAIGIFMQFMSGIIANGGLPGRGVSYSLWLMYFTWNVMWIFFYRGKLASSERFGKLCGKLRWPALILSVLISANFIECARSLPLAPAYSAEWEARAKFMAEQSGKGATHLNVAPIKTRPELIYSNISPFADWGYIGLAHYYGLESLCLIPEELSGNEEDVKKLMSGDLAPYVKLAEEGDPRAIFMTAHYRDPRRTFDKNAADVNEAEKWYRTGAEMGVIGCMRPLARILLPKNFWEALYWLVRGYIGMIRL